jgi:hypothetical protein
MVHEVGVQRIVAGDEDDQCTEALASGSAGLLPQRGQRAGEAGQHDGVQAGDVDPELERVGRRDAEQRPVRQRGLQGATFLRQVSGPVGGDAVGQLGRGAGQVPPCGQCEHLRAAPGSHERQRPRVLNHQVGEQPGRLSTGRPPDGRAVLAVCLRQRRFPERERRRPARGGVVGHLLDLEPGQPAAGDRRAGHRRRREHEGRVGPVRGADAAQPAQHVRDVGAEHAAVGVTLVDHHILQPAQERRPSPVRRQDAAVQHVGVGEHQPGVRTDPVPLRRLRVAIEGGSAHIRQDQRPQRPQLIGGEGLRRGQVERGRLSVRQQRRQHGQLVRQRLAGGGAGRDHDRLAGMRQRGGGGLVLPRSLDAPGPEAVDQQLRCPVRPVRGPPGTGWDLFHVGHRVVPAAGQDSVEKISPAEGGYLRRAGSDHVTHSCTTVFG